MDNKVQLITYADRLGGNNLADLHALLKGPLAGLFGGVHILPFFHPIDGSDAGFDPIDHLQVDARLGDWGSITALASDVPLMADVIVNHMSPDSPQFQDYLRHGGRSQFDGLFLTMNTVFPQGASESDLLSIYRPRPSLPFTCATLRTGERKILWTTFTSKQIDIDVTHAKGRAYLDAILHKLASSGITMVRLDAVGYAIKKAGSSCFMLPETFDFIDEFSSAARNLGLEVLVEVHAYYRRQIEIASHVDWVYDFALPPLVLHAFAFKTSAPLSHWIAGRPHNAVTVLDTHDGIGIIDIGADAENPLHHPGLVPPVELDQLVERIHAASGGQSRTATGAGASNLDLYQVNCTFFDALGRDPNAYLIARAIQFFVPGVPQIYYVGLLAGENDMDLLATTSVGRDINRRRYSAAEIQRDLRKPVVQQLLRLIRLRNEHDAFGGVFQAGASGPSALELAWSAGNERACLTVDFALPRATIEWTTPHGSERWTLG